MTGIFDPLSELQALLIQLRLEGLSNADIGNSNPGMDVRFELDIAQELLGVSTDDELGWRAIELGIVEGPACFIPSRPLTPTEESLIPYILRGLTNEEIHTESGLSFAAVGNHTSRMMLKFNAQNKMVLAASLYKYQNL